MFFLKDRKFKPGTTIRSYYASGDYTVVMVDRLNGLYYLDRDLYTGRYNSSLDRWDYFNIVPIHVIDSLFYKAKVPIKLVRRRL